MPLVTSTEMFKKAYDGGYAIGAFNVNNMEIIQGITEAAKEENAPLIREFDSWKIEKVVSSLMWLEFFAKFLIFLLHIVSHRDIIIKGDLNAFTNHKI